MTIDLGNGLEAASSLALHIIMGKSIVGAFFGILYRSTDSWSMENTEGKNELWRVDLLGPEWRLSILWGG